MKDIIGSGGKDSGSSSHTPVESPDSLRSIAYARVIDLISEGEIEGLVDGLKSVYLDGVPLQSKDGSFNFKDIMVDAVNGTQTQPYLPGSPSAEAENVVGVDIKYGIPCVRSISDQQATAARVRIGIPALSKQELNGDLNGSQVDIQIEIQNNGGGFYAADLAGKGTFKGKCTAMYERDFRVELPSPGPWDIRVTRLTPDSSSATLNNKTYWQTFTTIIDAKLNFPNSALVRMQLPSDQFNSIPTRSFRIRGIKCKVPANYNPHTRRYMTSGPGTTAQGTWDGSFKISWTNNPAWCFYDLLTKTRYGLGNFITAAHIDKWSLYNIGKYNDVYLPSGKLKKHTLSVTTSMSADAATNTITRSSGSFGGAQSVSKAGIKTNAVEQCYYHGDVDWYALGFRVGDSIMVSGFLGDDAGNNGGRVITSIVGPALGVASGVSTTVSLASSLPIVISLATPGDGFVAGDEVLLAGWINSDNNGRAVIKEVSGNKIKFTDEIAMVTETSGSRTMTVQDFTEPRFTSNLYLQSAEDAYKVIGNFASIFQSIAYWANGSIMLAQDAPKSHEYLFNSTNVEGGIFNYSGTARKARHTVAVVTWNDPDDHFKIKYKYCPNADGLKKYGYKPVQVSGFGCTSEGMALRIGRWMTRTELKDTQVVTFKTGLEGASRSPGAIVAVLDPYKAGSRVAGRVLGATTTSVTVDGSPQVIAAGIAYTMSCVMPDGSVEEKAITNPPGTYQTLTTAAFSQAPDVMAVWVMSATNLVPKLYRILTITEEEKTKFTITALEHDPNKFAEVESGIILEERPMHVGRTLTSPQNLILSESLYFGPGGQIKSRLDASWDSKPGVSRYLVRWNKESSNWIEAEVQTSNFTIEDAVPGIYSVQVMGYVSGNLTGSASSEIEILGKTDAPADVKNFVVVLKNFTIEMKWDAVKDLDIDKYEIRQGTTWSGGTTLAKVDSTSFSIEIGAVGSYTFWVAAIDSSGNYSKVPTSKILLSNPTTPSTLSMSVSSTPPT